MSDRRKAYTVTLRGKIDREFLVWADSIKDAESIMRGDRSEAQVVLVDAKYTSQACSACGLIVPKGLGVRAHSCACGYVADRDVNAARNVLARAMARTGPSGVNGGEAKPVPLPEKPRLRCVT